MSNTQAEPVREIQAALDAGPSGEKWVQHSLMVSEFDAVPGRGRDICHCGIGMRKETGEAMHNAAYIAACNPANMRNVLALIQSQAAEIERMRRLVEEVRNSRDWYERQGEICNLEGVPMIYASVLVELGEKADAVATTQPKG